MTTTKEKPKAVDFEKSMETLNNLVAKMEKGDLPLEKSLEYFEKGVQLIRQCQSALTTAEQKVQILMKQHGEETLEPYLTDNND